MILGMMWTRKNKDTMRQELDNVALFAPLLMTISRTSKSIRPAP